MHRPELGSLVAAVAADPGAARGRAGGRRRRRRRGRPAAHRRQVPRRLLHDVLHQPLLPLPRPLVRAPRAHPQPGHHRLAAHRADRGGLRGHRHPRRLRRGRRCCCSSPSSWTAPTGSSPATPCSTRRWAPGWTPPSTGPRSTPTTRASRSARPAAATTSGRWRSARWCCRPAATSSTSPSTRRTTTPAANTSPTAALSDRLDSVGWTVWVRRMIVLPIGERWALIAVLTALHHPAHHLLRPARRLRARRLLHHGRPRAALADPQGPPHRPRRPGTGRPRRHRPARRAVAARRPRAAAAPAPCPAPPSRCSAGRACSPAGVDSGDGSVLAVVGAAVCLRADLRRSPSPARSRAPSTGWSRRSSAPPNTARSCVLAASRGRERRAARGFRAGGGGRLPSLRHGVPHPRRHRRASALAGAGDRRTRRTDPAWSPSCRRRCSPPTGFTIALTALAVALALLVLVESIRFWVSSHGAPAVHDEGEPA